MQVFFPIKESMDKALLEEIKLLKQENAALDQKYQSLNAKLVTENQSLREETVRLASASE